MTTPRAIVLAAAIIALAMLAAPILTPRFIAQGQFVWVSIAGQVKACHIDEPRPRCWGWN